MEKSQPALLTGQEDAYAQMHKNTVDAKNQLKDTELVHFFHPERTGHRILFVGNSITLHGKCPEIGWNNDWGMAASTEEKDYVHRLMAAVGTIDPQAAFCICQVSRWECDYKNGTSVHSLFAAARAFDADVIVARFIENCPDKDFDAERFKEELDALLSFLNPSQKAHLMITTGFWRHPGDAAIIAYAKEKNLPCVELGDLGERDEMKALGLFEHGGVAIHPGDLGMEHIARRIFDEMKKVL